jgi:hypothetical protein
LRYLESSVLAFAILFGFACATLVFNLLPSGFFPFYLTGGLVLIIAIAMLSGFGNIFRLRTRVYFAIAAGITISYFSYAFFNFSSSGLDVIMDLTAVWNVLFRIAHTDIFTGTVPKLVHGNLMFQAVAAIDVFALIPAITLLGSREGRPFIDMSMREKFWAAMHDRSTFFNGLKYMAHGLLFQLLATALVIVGIFTVAGFLVAGNYFGLVIGPFLGTVIIIAVLVTVVGTANTLVARLVWGIPIQISVSLFASGFSMFLGLLFVNLPVVVIPQLIFPGTATTLATFFPAVLLDGIIGKKIAEAWTD